MPPEEPVQQSALPRWAFRVSVVVLVFVCVGLVAWVFSGGVTGSVTVLVRDADGGRTVQTLSLSDATLAPDQSEGVNVATVGEPRTFYMADGSSIGLEPAGIVRREGGRDGAMSVLVASPTPPSSRTPLAVTPDGSRVAWVNPSDGSVQVFERSERGTYLPLYFSNELRANSLVFSNEETLVIARMVDESTEIYAVRLQSGSVHKVSTIEGYLTLLARP